MRFKALDFLGVNQAYIGQRISLLSDFDFILEFAKIFDILIFRVNSVDV
jgi:hypothetical protein